MAEAVFALERVSRLHNLHLRQTHVTFGGVALAQTGHAVPPSTRAAVLAADAVLVAGEDEEAALDELMGDLDLRAQATRVRFGHHDDVVLVAPRTPDAAAWTVEKAFAIAERRCMRLTAVGDRDWNELVDAVASEHDHVAVQHVAPKVALPLAAFDAAGIDVAVVAPEWAEAMEEILAASATARVAAYALLAGHGPSVFVPAAEGGFSLAGAGVVNPSSMLLAAATMLDLGLGCATAAATLARAVSATLVDGPQTPDLLRRGVGATTREFTSRVVAAFQLTQPWGAAA
jgi:isocitrate/isopropylmalate dehydrogenase